MRFASSTASKSGEKCLPAKDKIYSALTETTKYEVRDSHISIQSAKTTLSPGQYQAKTIFVLQVYSCVYVWSILLLLRTSCIDVHLVPSYPGIRLGTINGTKRPQDCAFSVILRIIPLRQSHFCGANPTILTIRFSAQVSQQVVKSYAVV